MSHRPLGASHRGAFHLKTEDLLVFSTVPPILLLNLPVDSPSSALLHLLEWLDLDPRFGKIGYGFQRVKQVQKSLKTAADSAVMTKQDKQETEMEKHPILFVDDNAGYLQIVERIVEQTGVRAHYASSAEEALVILRRNRCEMMITDLNMPGMDGYRLSELARELFPEIYLVMATGAATCEVSSLAAEAGVSLVIAKPCRAEQIREIVGSVPAARTA